MPNAVRSVVRSSCADVERVGVNALTHILGDISNEEFLQHYWQRQPLLVRSAFSVDSLPVVSSELAVLAEDPDVESRIVLEAGPTGPWELRSGPFRAADRQTLPATSWTLLVQAIDLWVPEARDLLRYFDFLPRWRLDDIMASFAVEGGSVGPHFDQYDVFLIQAEGQRRWQIGSTCGDDTPLLSGCDLQILADFQPLHDWLVEPGDMLYLPPKVAHWGVARSECVTLSVGFRSPTLADMLGDLAIEISAQGNDQHYTDPALTPAMAAEDIDPAFIDQARDLLSALLNEDGLLEDWFARYMTLPKYPGLEHRTGEARTVRIGGRAYRNGELSED